MTKSQFKSAYGATRAAYRDRAVTPASADWFFGQRDAAVRAANRAADRVICIRHHCGYTAADRDHARREWVRHPAFFRALVREAGHYWLA